MNEELEVLNDDIEVLETTKKKGSQPSMIDMYGEILTDKDDTCISNT